MLHNQHRKKEQTKKRKITTKQQILLQLPSVIQNTQNNTHKKTQAILTADTRDIKE